MLPGPRPQPNEHRRRSGALHRLIVTFLRLLFGPSHIPPGELLRSEVMEGFMMAHAMSTTSLLLAACLCAVCLPRRNAAAHAGSGLLCIAALEHREITQITGGGYCVCAGFRRALITFGGASAAIALVYAFAAAFGRPHHEQALAPAVAPADLPAELATILPCTPQQPVRIFGGRVSDNDGSLAWPMIASNSLRRGKRGKHDDCSDCLQASGQSFCRVETGSIRCRPRAL